MLKRGKKREKKKRELLALFEAENWGLARTEVASRKIMVRTSCFIKLEIC